MKEAIHIQLLKPSMTTGTWDNITFDFTTLTKFGVEM